MAYYPDDDGNVICDDCWYGCDGTPCPQIHCRHDCHPEAHRYPAGALMDHARRIARNAIFDAARQGRGDDSVKTFSPQGVDYEIAGHGEKKRRYPQVVHTR